MQKIIFVCYDSTSDFEEQEAFMHYYRACKSTMTIVVRDGKYIFCTKQNKLTMDIDSIAVIGRVKLWLQRNNIVLSSEASSQLKAVVNEVWNNSKEQQENPKGLTVYSMSQEVAKTVRKPFSNELYLIYQKDAVKFVFNGDQTFFYSLDEHHGNSSINLAIWLKSQKLVLSDKNAKLAEEFIENCYRQHKRKNDQSRKDWRFCLKADMPSNPDDKTIWVEPYGDTCLQVGIGPNERFVYLGSNAGETAKAISKMMSHRMNINLNEQQTCVLEGFLRMHIQKPKEQLRWAKPQQFISVTGFKNEHPEIAAQTLPRNSLGVGWVDDKVWICNHTGDSKELEPNHLWESLKEHLPSLFVEHPDESTLKLAHKMLQTARYERDTWKAARLQEEKMKKLIVIKSAVVQKGNSKRSGVEIAHSLEKDQMYLELQEDRIYAVTPGPSDFVIKKTAITSGAEAAQSIQTAFAARYSLTGGVLEMLSDRIELWILDLKNSKLPTANYQHLKEPETEEPQPKEIPPMSITETAIGLATAAKESPVGTSTMNGIDQGLSLVAWTKLKNTAKSILGERMPLFDLLDEELQDIAILGVLIQLTKPGGAFESFLSESKSKFVHNRAMAAYTFSIAKQTEQVFSPLLEAVTEFANFSPGEPGE